MTAQLTSMPPSTEGSSRQVRSSSKHSSNASSSSASSIQRLTPTLEPSDAGFTYSGKANAPRARGGHSPFSSIPLLAAQRHMIQRRQARLRQDRLGRDLVHRGGSRPNGGADVGQLGQLQGALQAAVLALGAVRRQHHHVQLD